MKKHRKVISHARDVYPDASVQFCMGVHNYLRGDYDERLMYQETQDFRSGYYQAQYELGENYILKLYEC